MPKCIVMLILSYASENGNQVIRRCAWQYGLLIAWATLRRVRGAAGGGAGGDVPLAEHAGHLMNLVQVLAQSHTLRL